MKKTIVAFLFVMLSLSSVLADGGYFPQPGYWVRPGQQRAVIFYEDNTETMILTSSFQGNAKDLVWIVPSPSRPEVTKSSDSVFTNVASLARVKYSGGLEFGAVAAAAKGGIQPTTVFVLESKQVDYYDVNVIFATSSQDLAGWFNENGYSYPESYSYVLKSYIDKGWYFTAIKISPEAQGASEVMQDLKEGNPTPIKMVFQSDKVVFPLKISSVDFPSNTENKYGPAKDELIGATRKDGSGNTWTKVAIDEWKSNAVSADITWGDLMIDEQPGGINYANRYDNYRYSSSVPIYLYVIADSKYTAEGFYTQYGNWVTKSDIEKLGLDDSGKPYIEPKNDRYFLTSLSANYQKSQMNSDLIITKSDDNKKVNAGPETWQLFLYGLIIGLVAFVIWVFTPLGILFLIGTLILFFSSSKGLRLFAWIADFVSLGITVIIGIVFISIAAISGTLGDYMVISLIVSWVFALVIMGIFMLLSKHARED